MVHRVSYLGARNLTLIWYFSKAPKPTESLRKSTRALRAIRHVSYASFVRGEGSPGTRHASLRCLAFCRMILRRWSSTIPHSLISSKDRKQPKQVSSSSRQQFRMHGDRTALSISLIDVEPYREAPNLSTQPEENPGDTSQGQGVSRDGPWTLRQPHEPATMTRVASFIDLH
jgi:hypothetical protein